MSIADLRRDYRARALSEGDAQVDPMAQFHCEAGKLKRLSDDLEQNEIELFLTMSESQCQNAVLQLDAALRAMAVQSPP